MALRLAAGIYRAFEALLIAERDENTCRKDFTPSEAVALGRKLEELEKPAAAERKAEAGKANLPTSDGRPPSLAPKGATRDKVGAVVGPHLQPRAETLRIGERRRGGR